MKGRFLVVCVLVIGLALVLTGAVAAQTLLPGDGEREQKGEGVAEGTAPYLLIPSGRLEAQGASRWRQVSADGFGDPNNVEVTRLTRFGRYLYAGTANESSGAEVWRSANGTDWGQVNVDGFGDSNNGLVYGAAAFHDRLYVGTADRGTDGGAVWMMLDRVPLPLVLRNH